MGAQRRFAEGVNGGTARSQNSLCLSPPIRRPERAPSALALTGGVCVVGTCDPGGGLLWGGG